MDGDGVQVVARPVQPRRRRGIGGLGLERDQDGAVGRRAAGVFGGDETGPGAGLV
jgi:hypothetical protein